MIILGDVNPALLSAASLQNLADFVDQPGKGGAMIAAWPGRNTCRRPIAARRWRVCCPSTSAACAIPIRPSRRAKVFAVQPTELGLASPAMQLGDTPEETRTIWQNLPPLYWMIEAGQWKPGVRVLAENPTRTLARRPASARFHHALRWGGQGALPRHRRDLAMAPPRRRRFFRPLLDPDHPLPQPRRNCPKASARPS